MNPGGPTCVSVGGPVIHGGPVIPASSLSSGQDGTCTGRKHHSFPEPYQCAIRGPALPYHARTELVGKRFMCPRCPCTYSRKGGLTEHMRHIHENAARYRCETCGKGFSIRSHYYEHLAAHTGVKQYVCPTCKKHFTRRNYLKVHVCRFHPDVVLK